MTKKPFSIEAKNQFMSMVTEMRANGMQVVEAVGKAIKAIPEFKERKGYRVESGVSLYTMLRQKQEGKPYWTRARQEKLEKRMEDAPKEAISELDLIESAIKNKSLTPTEKQRVFRLIK